MKEKANNEIDLLLRRMSRQDGSAAGNGDAQHLGQHLDVDELSSYAQNALPAAARARYTEHLTECSTCRKLVTELSLSLGVTAAAGVPAEAVALHGGLKKFLASLFSPMVLRYAGPALGLIIVAAIGFVVLRNRSGQTSLARLNADQAERAPVTAPRAGASESPVAGFVEPKNESASARPAESAAEQPEAEAPKQSAPKRGMVADGASAGAETGLVAAAPPPVREEKAATEPAAKPNTEAEPAPAKAATADADEQKKREATAKKQDTVTVRSKDSEISTAANEPVRDTFRRVPPAQRSVDNKVKESPSPAGGTASVGGVRTLSSTERGQADRSDADTRTVAGRRFRKERGIWTDTAYDSSTATVNVARGSEQFRALVADEPEIKKIAEQLDGEVIVVWKGRAYRIR